MRLAWLVLAAAGCAGDRGDPADTDEDPDSAPPDGTGGEDSGETTPPSTGDTGEPVPPDPDADADGFPASVDCDDGDDQVFPGAPEICGDDRITDCASTATSDDGLVTVDGAQTFVDLQEALRAANAGSVVTVCPGTWVGAFGVDVPVEIVGHGGREVTILDGANAGTVLSVPGGTRITGLTLTNGRTANFGGGLLQTTAGDLVVTSTTIIGNSASYGGGVDLTSGTTEFVDCEVTGNDAIGGGGISVAGGDLVLTDTVVSGNTAEDGGGVYLTQASLTGGLVTGNTGTSRGGGLYVYTNGTVSGVEVIGNDADYGGGLYSFEGYGSEVLASTFSGNTARRDGGGVHVEDTWLFADTTIVGNTANDNGGGLDLQFFFGVPPSTITGCTITDNQALGGVGGGIWLLVGELLVDTSTVARNTAGAGGGGISLDSDADLRSVVSDWGSPPADDNVPDDVGTVTDYSASGYGAASTFECDERGCDPEPVQVCVDVDGDGWGPFCELGEDCDDTDAGIHPTAPDALGDGVDADCSGVDGPGLVEGFESGAPPVAWPTFDGDFSFDSAGHTGSHSLSATELEAETPPIDLSSCGTPVVWSYWGRRPPQAPEFGTDLVLSYWDGTGWIEDDRWFGDDTSDPDFVQRTGTLPIELPAEAVQLRLEIQTRFADGRFLLDDLEIRCGAGDSDGDAVDAEWDCDDNDALHHADCGICVDVDLDGFGTGCDPGTDCDEGTDLVHPGRSDPFGDGVDSDCSGIDGPGLHDDFEGQEIDDGVWESVLYEVNLDDAYAVSGSRSLEIGAAGWPTATTRPMDTTACSAVAWGLQALQWNTYYPVVVEWDAGAGFTEERRFDAVDDVALQFGLESGTITDPAALSTGFRLRLRSDVDDAFVSGGSYHLFVDDPTVACAVGDGDGDGVDAAFDCDDGAIDHWDDCATCVDGDVDGFGTGCDRGLDCDDAVGTTHPGTPDPFGDGIDADCSGEDGVRLASDDFEDVHLGPLWASSSGTTFSTIYGHDGGSGWSLDLGTASITTGDIDSSACGAVGWSVWVFRQSPAADVGDIFSVDYDDGSGWVSVAALEGTGLVEPYTQMVGSIADPLALSPTFRMRLRVAGVGPESFIVDDLAVVCQ